jgi:hypothetical protein
VTGDVSPAGIDIRSWTDVEHVEVQGAGGNVSVFAGGTV